MHSQTVIVKNAAQLIGHFMLKNTMAFPLKVTFNHNASNIIIEQDPIEKEYNFPPTIELIEGNVYKTKERFLPIHIPKIPIPPY